MMGIMRRLKKKGRLAGVDRTGVLLCGLAAAAATPLSAHAQSIDYGALEQLFGEPVTTSVTG